jgi:hypothetical protein
MKVNARLCKRVEATAVNVNADIDDVNGVQVTARVETCVQTRCDLEVTPEKCRRSILFSKLSVCT